MTYLNNWTLWLLLLALLPIIIHMLNRLRYKTVQWAAMYFLLKANKAATRRAKLRQYLLLLFRALAILFLIWAMMRPQVGGWIGKAAGGAPEVVIVLLDRSATMQSKAGADRQETKLAHAQKLLAAAGKTSPGSRFVLIENVLRSPLEIADTATLGTMQMGEATDSAADIPAMFRAGLEYLIKNKPGSAELWLASDLQSSNWRNESAEWQDIAARFAGLPQDMHVRVLDLSSAPGTNLGIAVKTAEFRPSKAAPEKGTLAISLETKSGGATGTFPLKTTRDGATSQSDLVLNSPVRRETVKTEIAKLPEGGGWGKFELPADDNLADNVAYFTYRAPTPLHAAIVSELPAARRFAAAAAPDKTRTDRTAEVVAPARAADIKWKNAALIVWQGAAPGDMVAKQLQAFVEGGGVLLAFPAGGDSGNGPLGITWSAAENAKEPFRISSWDELDGPLARTDNGASLPLARMELTRRQLARIGDNAHVHALFADGQPFLVAQTLGAGRIVACAASPDAEWGTFGEGFVLLPMMQRLLTQGGARLVPPAMATAGEWKPAEGEFWTALETTERRDPRWHAGIFKNAGRLIALNRPEAEDDSDYLDAAAVKKLLPNVKVEVLTKAAERNPDGLQSEIWPAMIIATMVFMIFEMLLATSKTLIPQKPKPRVPVAARKEEVGV